LYTAIGIPATVGGILGTQAIRGDYGPALRRAVAGIVSNPQELRRVLAAPESQRPGLIMTLARNVLAAEAGTSAADIMSLIGEDNAAQKR
jgi:UDP-N-acetylenolpyruvoylglucosamine reductase